MTNSNFKPVEEQLAYLKKGFAEIIPENELVAKLENSRNTGKPLRVYLGVDPTAPDIHLGHTVVLRKLKHFQDLGHTAIFLIGDFSAMIGDPTGVSETRPPLSREQVDANAKTYLEQVFKILDKEKTEVHYNSEWLGKMSAEAVVRLCGRYRLARMLEREDFRSRLQNNQPISVHELLYPLLTACDAVELRSDVEIGATEQKFNLLVHRDIQIACAREAAVQRQLENPDIDVEYKREAQVCFTMPILVGLDGQRKMSKSLGNYVGITEPPSKMFGKLMSIPDSLISTYTDLLTDRSSALDQMLGVPGYATNQPQSELAKMLDPHPMERKMELAELIVSDFHGKDAARKAADKFQREVRDKQLPEDMPVVRLKEEEWYQKFLTEGTTTVALRWLITAWNLAPSLAEAERLIKAGAVEFNDQRITDPRHQIRLTELRDSTLRVGKRKFKKAVE
jgi:tyrosyl-tRNA synthetase